MKKLHLTLIALFVLCAVQAQTVTEESLLGDWNLRKISMQGNMADLKTGEIEVSDAFAAEKGQAKETLAAKFKERLGTMHGTLAFLSGKRMQFQVGEAPMANGTYTITQQGDKQYLADEYSGSKMQVYFKEGLLYWEVLSNDGIVIMAWEKQETK